MHFTHMNCFYPSSDSYSVGESDLQESASIIKMGPGYYSAQFLEWIGTKLLNGIEGTVIRVRLARHQRNIRRFSLNFRKAVANQKAVISFVYDALEMARSLCSCSL